MARTTQPASFVFTHFETAPESTGISSKAYAAILSVLVSQYSLYGYDAAAHLTEETKGADKNGPIAILSSIGIISVFGWAYILALTFSIQVSYQLPSWCVNLNWTIPDIRWKSLAQNFDYLYDVSNETAGTFVPAQILYDAFHGRYHNSSGAIILLFIIWGSFFFGGLSITTSAARVVRILSLESCKPFNLVKWYFWEISHMFITVHTVFFLFNFLITSVATHRYMHCRGIKEFPSRPYGGKCTRSTRSLPMQCGYVQPSAFSLDFLSLSWMLSSLQSLRYVQ